MEIRVNKSDITDDLQEYRNHKLDTDWFSLLDGYWGEDTYHGGYLEYSVARTIAGVWILNSCSRYEYLDDVTQTDIDEENFLNDDQLQAIFDHGSLEAAQSFRYNRIVAVAFGCPPNMDWELIGNKLYTALLEAGGKEIIEIKHNNW